MTQEGKKKSKHFYHHQYRSTNSYRYTSDCKSFAALVYKQLVPLKWSVGGLRRSCWYKIFIETKKPIKFLQTAWWLLNAEWPRQFILSFKENPAGCIRFSSALLKTDNETRVFVYVQEWNVHLHILPFIPSAWIGLSHFLPPPTVTTAMIFTTWIRRQLFSLLFSPTH